MNCLLNCFFLIYTIQPTRVKSNSKTWIYILSEIAVSNIIFRNLTASISDYLSQFLVAPNIFFNPSHPKSNKCDQDLIKKILFWIIFQLTGLMYCLRQTWTLLNQKNVSLKFDSLLDTWQISPWQISPE